MSRSCHARCCLCLTNIYSRSQTILLAHKTVSVATQKGLSVLYIGLDIEITLRADLSKQYFSRRCTEA